MAEKRLDDFTELTDFANDDLGMVVDVSVSPTPGEVGQTKNFKFSTLFSWITGLLTKSDVGLSNVDNTSDADKPRSTATINADTALQDNIDAEEDARIAADSALAASVDLKLPIDGIDSVLLPSTITGGDWYTVAEAPTTVNISGNFTFDILGTGEGQHLQFNAGSSLRINSYVNVLLSSTYLGSDVDLTGVRILMTTGGANPDMMYLQAKFEDAEIRTRQLIYKANNIDSSTQWTLVDPPIVQNTLSGFEESARVDIVPGNHTYQSTNHYVLNNKRVINTDDLTTVNTAISDEEIARVAADSALATSIETAKQNIDWELLLNSPFLLWLEDQYEASATGQTNFDDWLYDTFINTSDPVLQDDIWDSYFASPEGQNDYNAWNAGPGGGTGTENQFRASGEGMAGLDLWKNSPMGESTLKTTPAWTTWTNTYDFSDYLASATGESQFNTWLSGQTLGAREFLDAIVNP